MWFQYNSCFCLWNFKVRFYAVCGTFTTNLRQTTRFLEGLTAIITTIFMHCPAACRAFTLSIKVLCPWSWWHYREDLLFLLQSRTRSWSSRYRSTEYYKTPAARLLCRPKDHWELAPPLLNVRDVVSKLVKFQGFFYYVIHISYLRISFLLYLIYCYSKSIKSYIVQSSARASFSIWYTSLGIRVPSTQFCNVRYGTPDSSDACFIFIPFLSIYFLILFFISHHPIYNGHQSTAYWNPN